jgi:sugar/nucleoside kinase (ribokinase family)
VYRYQEHEVFAGGAFAIANHLSGICESVHLVTLLGNEDSREGFVRSALRSNVEPAFFFRDDGPTVVKKRYLDQYVNQKVFEVNYLNPLFLSREVEKRVIDHCVSRIADYDLVLIADFGHGLLTPDIIEALSSRASVLAVNAQMNAANAGFNLITRYRSPQIICLDEPEARVAAQAQFNDIETVAHSLRAETGADCLVVTLGKSGSIAVTAAGETTRCPIFSTNVVDTVGAGDAFFSFAAPSYAAGLPPAIVSFIGNAVGALAVAIVGNKRPVEKHEVMEFIQNLLY